MSDQERRKAAEKMAMEAWREWSLNHFDDGPWFRRLFTQSILDGEERGRREASTVESELRLRIKFLEETVSHLNKEPRPEIIALRQQVTALKQQPPSEPTREVMHEKPLRVAVQELTKKVTEQQATLDECKKVLEPMAEMAHYVYKVRPQTTDDTSASGLPPRLTVGHCRAAASLLEKLSTL